MASTGLQPGLILLVFSLIFPFFFFLYYCISTFFCFSFWYFWCCSCFIIACDLILFLFLFLIIFISYFWSFFIFAIFNRFIFGVVSFSFLRIGHGMYNPKLSPNWLGIDWDYSILSSWELSSESCILKFPV